MLKSTKENEKDDWIVRLTQHSKWAERRLVEWEQVKRNYENQLAVSFFFVHRILVWIFIFIILYSTRREKIEKPRNICSCSETVVLWFFFSTSKLHTSKSKSESVGNDYSGKRDYHQQPNIPNETTQFLSIFSFAFPLFYYYYYYYFASARKRIGIAVLLRTFLKDHSNFGFSFVSNSCVSFVSLPLFRSRFVS